MIKHQGELLLLGSLNKGVPATINSGITYLEGLIVYIASVESVLAMTDAADMARQERRRTCHFTHELLSQKRQGLSWWVAGSPLRTRRREFSDQCAVSRHQDAASHDNLRLSYVNIHNHHVFFRSRRSSGIEKVGGKGCHAGELYPAESWAIFQPLGSPSLQFSCLVRQFVAGNSAKEEPTD